MSMTRKRRSARDNFDSAEVDPHDPTMVIISTVYELRSLQLYRNDLTSKGLAAILDKCPHLDSLDVWNCLNIVRDNALQAAKSGWIKTNKLTTKLITDCYNIILNKRFILRKKARKYMIAALEKYMMAYGSDFDKKFEPYGPINECSTCLMLEYFAER
jgi:hypothetical protein